MFRQITNPNGGTLRQLISDISIYESYLSCRDTKIPNIAEWILKITVPTPAALLHRQIPGGELYLTKEQKNKVLGTYFGSPLSKYSRYNMINNGIRNRIKQIQSGVPDENEFYNLLARKFDVWMLKFNRDKDQHSGNKLLMSWLYRDKDQHSGNKFLMSWLYGELGFYYVKDHTQYCFLLSAVKEVGYDVFLPVTNDEKSESLKFFAASRNRYLRTVLHRNGSQKLFPDEYNQASLETKENANYSPGF